MVIRWSSPTKQTIVIANHQEVSKAMLYQTQLKHLSIWRFYELNSWIIYDDTGAQNRKAILGKIPDYTKKVVSISALQNK